MTTKHEILIHDLKILSMLVVDAEDGPLRYGKVDQPLRPVYQRIEDNYWHTKQYIENLEEGLKEMTQLATDAIERERATLDEYKNILGLSGETS